MTWGTKSPLRRIARNGSNVRNIKRWKRQRRGQLMDAHGQETFAECYSTLLPLRFDPAQWAHEVAFAHCQQRHWAPLKEDRGVTS